METDFTPIQSLIGGALIGLSAVLLMATNGRIAGISGIVSKLLPGSTDKSAMAPGVMFVLGLLLAMPLALLVFGFSPPQTITATLPLLAVAGLLVGFGSATGNGCTSGHGVCGMSRLSVRSIVATVTFMATAFVTVLILRHVVGG
ncbi:YeeE/YedE family protein [Pseudahrensia aquimaris]|uniref:YeeE/YedE family protein n=1 Tax=Pseudahrensia aquimaris TaxID=744461 RepID=A0ABW3FJ17_9HYPH